MTSTLRRASLHQLSSHPDELLAQIMLGGLNRAAVSAAQRHAALMAARDFEISTSKRSGMLLRQLYNLGCHLQRCR